jgi:serine O-acetyltransferase
VRALPGVVRRIVEGARKNEILTHVGAVAIPSSDSVRDILARIRDLLYLGYFGRQGVSKSTLEYHVGEQIEPLFKDLSHQITMSIRHECKRLRTTCVDCVAKGQDEAVRFLRQIPALQGKLAEDVRAAYDGDPAAKSYDEIIFSYPATQAITTYRIAHELHARGVPLVPRIMTEYAHSVTGIDIHPGATIGRRFFIDHGTGVVIGETTQIGDNVKVYQGVTLGALSFPQQKDGSVVRGKKRHPTIEDDVTIYAGATILGGETVIGKGSVVGGNVWLTHSIPPGTKVAIAEPTLKFAGGPPKRSKRDGL